MALISRKYRTKLAWFENNKESKLQSEDYKYDYYFCGIKIFSHDYEMTGKISTEGSDKKIGFGK